MSYEKNLQSVNFKLINQWNSIKKCRFILVVYSYVFLKRYDRNLIRDMNNI